MDAVCFDMDGVLVDSEDYWVPYEKADLLSELGLESLDVDEITGMNYQEIYDYLVSEYAIDMARDEFLGWYERTATRIYDEDVSLLPGAHALIDALRARGLAVAIVSSSPHDWIDIVRERFDLDVDAVVSANAFDGPGKPEPGVYERAAAELGVSPGATIAVEDSVHGIEAANRAGMYVIGFRLGDTDPPDRGNADFVAESPTALRDHLLELADRE